MRPSYHIDPCKYSLDKLKEDLKYRKLIPSRKSLKIGLDDKFSLFESLGWTNIQDLRNAIKNKKLIETFSVDSGIDIDYLILLRREVNSYFPNPVALGNFSGISPGNIKKLTDLGIKNSKHLFEKCINKKNIHLLVRESGIPFKTLAELVGLSDLVRAYGVGPAFARLLFDAGIHSISDLQTNTAEQIIILYEEQTGKKADFSESDIQFSLDIIRVLDFDKTG